MQSALRVMKIPALSPVIRPNATTLEKRVLPAGPATPYTRLTRVDEPNQHLSLSHNKKGFSKFDGFLPGNL